MEISKELLSEVLVGLELDYEYPIEFYSNKNAFRYWVIESPKYQSTSEYINIYELAFKLKEWAFNEGYQLEISRYWNIPTYYCKLVIRGGDFCEECGESRAIYELEDLQEIDIVVKACEWILNEKQLQH